MYAVALPIMPASTDMHFTLMPIFIYFCLVSENLQFLNNSAVVFCFMSPDGIYKRLYEKEGYSTDVQSLLECK